mmetsp:Transcript_23549/g.28960  ORF Transcript_23549/g.28960 Transcript_23549/m.28960 type:complete len:215 (-) Transcript_23549:564-1208(-)
MRSYRQRLAALFPLIADPFLAFLGHFLGNVGCGGGGGGCGWWIRSGGVCIRWIRVVVVRCVSRGSCGSSGICRVGRSIVLTDFHLWFLLHFLLVLLLHHPPIIHIHQIIQSNTNPPNRLTHLHNPHLHQIVTRHAHPHAQPFRRITLVEIVIEIERHHPHTRASRELDVDQVRLSAIALPVRVRGCVADLIYPVSRFGGGEGPHGFVPDFAHGR